MDSLPIDSAFTNRRVLSAAASQVDTSSWLATLLAAYETQADLSAQTGEFEKRLKHTSFEAIVMAIEVARSRLTNHAEIRLYQDWIAANAGASQHLFAAWFNLGVVLAREGDHAQAVIAYDNARRLKPDFCPAAVNLGLTLETIGQADAALRAWQDAIQSDEARTTLLNQSGRLMEAVGRLDEAETVLRTSLLTDTAQPDVLQHWLHLRQKMCRWPVLATDIPGLPEAELLRHSGPLGVLALTDDVSVQREVTTAWIERKMPPAPTRLSPPEGYRHARTRVGYLSSDFCRHAMSFLIAELFERHDRSRFEIFGYCSTLEDGSEIRQRVVAAFDHHRIIRDCSDQQAAQLIRDDEIDILIDLNGLTARTRLAVLRWRPAPIQATYLGFIGPVPLPELDYLLCDDFVIPPAQAAAYHPAPLSIARNYQANDSKRTIGPALSRQDVGLPTGRFVFCCFSNHYKITETMFVAWMSILRQADNAVLWLTVDNVWSQANLHARAEREGIAPERILFAERTSPELYMSRLSLADLFLDTFPYNAGTIASDAMRMRLPLLTLSGASFASRMAGSLLNVIGAQQGIAASLSDYVAIATMLATDTTAYASYRQHFSGDAWKNTAGDTARFTAEFEATLTRLMATPGLAIADNPECDSNDPEDASLHRIENVNFKLIDLVDAAEAMAAEGKVDHALHLYESWLRQSPADPLRHVAHFNHGSLLLQTGHPARAALAFTEASQIEPGFLPASINAGLAFERLSTLR